MHESRLVKRTTPEESRPAFGSLKAWLRGAFHGISPKHLQRYLDGYSSASIAAGGGGGEIFGFVPRRVARGQPLPYRQLVAEGTA